MENKTVRSCTDFVHIGRSYYVFSRTLPLIQSCTPTNSPFRHRAHLVSYVHTSCTLIHTICEYRTQGHSVRHHTTLPIVRTKHPPLLVLVGEVSASASFLAK